MTRARTFAVLVLSSTAGLGCGRDVAQTAEPGPPPGLPPSVALLDCSDPNVAVTLPEDAVFGDGSEPPSVLRGSAYGPGEGPGLFIAARDAFRVYLNGELVTESTAPRAPEFVPLTLLPGDNALSVVVAAKAGTPSVILELNELERSHATDSGWKVSTAPSGDFRAAGYDDSSWSAALDLGGIGALPGCDPTIFPLETRARWLGPPGGTGSTAAFRKVIRIAPIGYGENASGGFGATPALATTWDELVAAAEEPETPAVILLAEGLHDFRQTGDEIRAQDTCPNVCTEDATITTYHVLTGDDTCAQALVSKTRNERVLYLGSNKTLVGLGRGAQLRGVSLEFGGSHNLIARNLALFDVNPGIEEAGDAFGLTQPTDVWIDHCTTKWISDGFTDTRAGTQNVTVSWVRYDGSGSASCSGLHTKTSQIADSTATFHHVFFDHVDSHSPRAAEPLSRVHVFNSVLSDNPTTAVEAGCAAQVLMEANTFENVAFPTSRLTCSDDTRPGLIFAPPDSNSYRGNVGEHRGGDGQEPRDAVFTPPYRYTLDRAQDAWLDVLSRAGAGGPWALPLVLD